MKRILTVITFVALVACTTSAKADVVSLSCEGGTKWGRIGAAAARIRNTSEEMLRVRKVRWTGSVYSNVEQTQWMHEIVPGGAISDDSSGGESYYVYNSAGGLVGWVAGCD